jgi:uncharacterized protein YggT (Ycf19 family)
MPIKTAHIFLGFVNFVLWVVEGFLTLRFLLRLFGANPVTPFTQFIYQSTLPILQPFSGIFPSPALSGGYVFEFTTLFAIIIYALVAYIIAILVEWLGRLATRQAKPTTTTTSVTQS